MNTLTAVTSTILDLVNARVPIQRVLALPLMFAAMLCLVFVSSASAAKWGRFKKSCAGDGVAKYSAILHGIPFGQSWERACARQGAVVGGKRFTRPSRCINRRTAMWGEFIVRDRSCARPRARLKWGSFKNNGCVITNRQGWGMRSYSAVLWGIPHGQSWERTCARTGATVAGRRFSHPTSCVKADLKDAAKVVRFISKKIAKAAKGTKHPKIYLAAKTTAIIAKIVKKANPALNIWGVFYVPDSRCPTFGF
ncbi:MAG: hypothetical protein ACI9XZ_004175 [Alphaproteobacteria bacterium]|jgi:hypothetical protein